MIGSVVFGLASLVGLVFGSVSLATVVRAGSTLPANAIFSPGLRRSAIAAPAASTDFGSFLHVVWLPSRLLTIFRSNVWFAAAGTG